MSSSHSTRLVFLVRSSLAILATASFALAQEATPTVSGPTVTTDPESGVTRIQGRSGFFERLKPRPEQSPEELAARTASLRSAYSRPPADWPSPIVDPGVKWTELGLLPRVEHPSDNPPTKEKIALGRALFFDPRLSSTGEMACASCHDPDLHWADGRTTSFGLGRTQLKRNAPSIMNLGLVETLFWDGRARSLEDQAEQVLQNPQEMNCSEAILLERIAPLPNYREAFQEVFGDPEVTLERVAMAIACFERTIVGGRSQFDRFLRGDHTALSDSALRGLDLFRTDARCMNCHHGPLLTDNQFHDVGLSYYGRKYEDLGRYEVTQRSDDVGRFRTPTLRNVANTGPYMHNGLFGLPNVLRMYNAGMPTLVPKPEQQDDELFPRKSPHLRPLGLNNQDLEDLEAFLESLSEPTVRHRPPEYTADGPVLKRPTPAQAAQTE